MLEAADKSLLSLERAEALTLEHRVLLEAFERKLDNFRVPAGALESEEERIEKHLYSMPWLV